MEVISELTNPLRIIAADYDALSRLDIVRALNERGHQVLAEVSDGGELIERALQLETDAILFDVHLPTFNGFDALKRIRESKPVVGVVLTADANPEQVHRAIADGASAFLLKPVNADQLSASLRLACSQHAQAVKLEEENVRLRRTLDARKLIERAKGVLMKRHRWGEAEAFRRLQRTAMNLRTSMADLARQIIDGVPVEL